MPLDQLKTAFGFEEFRPGQREIIDAILAGQDVLAIMPTGGGKSLCYQLPALVQDGVVIVISPLIALMRDQVTALRNIGVAAGALTSANTDEETDAVFSELENETLKLLYLAPERLANPATRLMLTKIKPSFLAIDEAHCVSEWGHDFRPDYLRIGALRDALDVPLAAFTATADTQTRNDIDAKLFGNRPRSEFIFGFNRPNIHLRFASKNQPRRQILDFVNPRKGQSGIIYCATRAKCETLATALREAGHSAQHYHAGMEPDDRRAAEHRFKFEDGLIMVATVAFGMGVDKPDIRFVVHADLPKTIEGYYQEIGRAGRDGAPAETLTLFGSDDIRFRRMQIAEGLGDVTRKDFDNGRLNAMLGLAMAHSCRRQELLAYFGDAIEPCNHCDLCDTPPNLFDGTEPVRMVLSAILRSEERFGAGHVIDILRGIKTDKIKNFHHDALSTFGIGKDRSKGEWNQIILQMLAQDLIRPDAARHGALRMTQSARPLLRGEDSITLRKEDLTTPQSRSKVKALVAEEDEPLFSALRAERRKLAEAQKVPAYIVFTDAVLIAMVQQKPIDLDAFSKLPGVGAKKLERYGSAFLNVLNGDAARTHPTRRKLAGRESGALFDQLQDAMRALEKGPNGLDKPLSCSTPILRRFAEQRPSTVNAAVRILGEKRMERFGEVFLQIVNGD